MGGNPIDPIIPLPKLVFPSLLVQAHWPAAPLRVSALFPVWPGQPLRLSQSDISTTSSNAESAAHSIIPLYQPTLHVILSVQAAG